MMSAASKIVGQCLFINLLFCFKLAPSSGCTWLHSGSHLLGQEAATSIFEVSFLLGPLVQNANTK